ncbi:MAG: hypothetical protein ACRD2B_07440 [Terriglobia bacterium]
MMSSACVKRHLAISRFVLFALGAVMAGAVWAVAQPSCEPAAEVTARTNLGSEKAPTHAAGPENLRDATASRTTPAFQASFQARRDPFRVPPPPVPSRRRDARGGKEFVNSVNLPPGPRGLVIAQLRLEGIVSENATHQMIAVVTNSTDRAYFLRVNEQLYDGVVSRITPSAIYFRERARNSYGIGAEVVKTLRPASGELQ